MKCFICGSPIIKNELGFRCSIGRPKTYCSDYCRDFQKYFIAMQKSLSKISLDYSHKRQLRGDLFRVANSLKLISSRSFCTKKKSGNYYDTK
jgi:hypothetical protein